MTSERLASVIWCLNVWADKGPKSLPSVTVQKAALVQMPGTVDCNSPGHWDGDTLLPLQLSSRPGTQLWARFVPLGKPSATKYDNQANGGRWIESTYKDEDGTLYGWYHNEPHPVCPGKEALTAPRIGAVSSKDNGATWHDLGFLLEAPRDSLQCETKNHYFAGGNGDFSVILDNAKEYFYFFISTYHRNVSEQGVAVARMRYADRNSTVGKGQME